MSNKRYLDYNGECHTIAEWGAITGINANTISNRLRSGWSVKDTLTTPSGVVPGGRKIIPCTGCKHWKRLYSGSGYGTGMFCCDYANSRANAGLPGTRGKKVDGQLVFPPAGRECPYWTTKTGG